MNLDTLVAKLRLYPIAVGAGLLALALAGFAYFRMDAVPTLSKEEAELTSQVQTMDRNVTQAVDLSEQLDELKAAIATVNERLVEREQRAINYQYLYDLEQGSGVRISGLAQNEVVTDARQRAGKPSPKEFVGVPFNVTVQGTFGAVMEFLHRLETGRRFARIDTFSVTTAPGTSPDAVSLTLQFEFLGKK